ncbi:MAG: PEGA domain-containing protein [Bacteroides sp.]|nr:PEGA domain-containing protein [Bacteroides sp.]
MSKTLERLLPLCLSLAFIFTTNANAQRAIVTGERYASVTLQSTPAGAKVYLNNKLICASTPATVQIPYKGIIMPGKKKDAAERMRRSAEASKITLLFQMDGCTAGEEILTPTITEVKKDYVFTWQPTVIHEFPEANQRRDSGIPRGEARKTVSRDNAGATALEKTIIRWNFESEPKGARVFWRVISSVPEEVKNTNETYLGNTPFEETRSFNIQGLNYENSRDVQIEIKVRRKGYMDQTKRFNVRQAIDQQEISSFFDMIAEEE